MAGGSRGGAYHSERSCYGAGGTWYFSIFRSSQSDPPWRYKGVCNGEIVGQCASKRQSLGCERLSRT